MANGSVSCRVSALVALLILPVGASELPGPVAPPVVAERTASFWATPNVAVKPLDVRFTNLDVVEALRFLAGEETNVVATTAISRQVTVDLRQVRPGHALDYVLRSLGVSARIEDRTIFLSSMEDRVIRFPIVAQENSKIWDELATGLTGLISGSGTIALNKIGGVMTVRDDPVSLDRLEAHVNEVLHALTRQIEIEVEVLEAVYEDNEGAGIEWAVFDGILDPGWGLLGGAAGGAVGQQAVTDLRENFQVGLLKPGKWRAFLDAFDERIQLNMISRPRITALSNQPAQFKVKERIPFLSKTTSQEGGVVLTEFQLEFDEAGIEVFVTASVGEGDEITMEVHPIISSVVGFTATLPDLGPQPIIDTRESSSLVRLPEGHSLVMSGMMQDRENVSSLGVPVISRIPLLGRLFRSEQTRIDKTEIIIVLTPRSRQDPGARSLATHDRLRPSVIEVARDDVPTQLAAARTERAWEMLVSADAATAMVLARGAARARPAAWWTLNNQALALRAAGLLGESERTLHAAVQSVDPAPPIALLNYGTLILHRGRPAEAAVALRAAFESAPPGIVRDEASLAWALALELEGRDVQAQEVLENQAGGRSGRLADRVLPRLTRILATRETALTQ